MPKYLMCLWYCEGSYFKFHFLIVFYIGLAFNNFYNVCINSNTLLIDLIIGSFASYDVLMSHMKMTVLLHLSQFTYFFLVLLYQLYSSVKYSVSSFKSHTSFIFKYDKCCILYYFSILSFFLYYSTWIFSSDLQTN